LKGDLEAEENAAEKEVGETDERELGGRSSRPP